MFTVLFICSGNTCRSPMAERLLRHKLARGKMPVVVYSAGLYAQTGEPMSDGARRALRGRGVDADGFRARVISAQLLDAADLILTMTGEHLSELSRLFPAVRDKTSALSGFCGEKGDIPDPFGGGGAEYERCCARLDDLSDIVAEKLAAVAGDRKS